MALLDCLFRSEGWQVSCDGLQDPPGGSCLSAGGVTVVMDSSGHKAFGNALPDSHAGPHTPSHPHPLVDPSLLSSDALSAPLSHLDMLSPNHNTNPNPDP